MKTTVSNIQNPRGGPLWSNGSKPVLGVAYRTASKTNTQSSAARNDTQEVINIDDFEPSIPSHQHHKSSKPKETVQRDSAGRVRVACDFCQINHYKCSGNMPCTNCTSHARQCVYSAEAATAILPSSQHPSPLHAHGQSTGLRDPPNNEIRRPQTSEIMNVGSNRYPGAHDASKDPQQDSSFKSGLPQQVLDRLGIWYDKVDASLPPCASRDVGSPPNRHKDGRKALWKHISGDILTVTMYDLPGFEYLSDVSRKYVLVAQGAAFGPHIVHFHGRGSRGKDLKYKAWLGVEGDNEGFENDPSVFKGYVEKPSETASIPFQAAKTASQHDSIDSELPLALKEQLERWYTRHGRKLPPCSTSCTAESLLLIKSQEDAAWTHKSGKPLKVERYQVPGFPKLQRCLIVVSGNGIGPHIVHYHSSRRKRSSFYKIWIGLEGDSEGFETKPSVYKAPVNMHTMSQSNTICEDPAGLRAVGSDGRSRKSVRYEEGSDQEAENGRTASRKRKRYVEEDSSDDESVEMPSTSLDRAQHAAPKIRVSSKPQPQPEPQVQVLAKATPAIRLEDLDAHIAKAVANHLAQDPASQTPKAPAKPVTNAFSTEPSSSTRSEPQQLPKPPTPITPNPLIPNAALRAHLLTNVVLHIYGHESNAILRHKDFGYCDTIQKLFNQARVAKIFRNSGYKALAWRINGRDEINYIAEGDDEDFEKFVEALQNEDCWELDGQGRVKGCCTVEIGEMKDG